MTQENPELQAAPPEPEEGPSPVPPEELKPWYYQYWFLHPMIVFWPLWPVLIIRSPWHNGLVAGALAWAWLIIGGYLAFVRLQVGGTVALSTVAIIAPGLLFTVITQAHWIINRRRILNPPTDARAPGTPDEYAASRPRRSMRRRRRRR